MWGIEEKDKAIPNLQNHLNRWDDKPTMLVFLDSVFDKCEYVFLCYSYRERNAACLILNGMKAMPKKCQ